MRPSCSSVLDVVKPCQRLRLVAVVVFSSFWHALAFVCSCGNQENKFVCFARLFLFGMLFTYSRDWNNNSDWNCCFCFTIQRKLRSISRGPQMKTPAALRHRKCVSLSISRLHMVPLWISIYSICNRTTFLCQIWAPQGTAIFVHFWSLQSRKICSLLITSEQKDADSWCQPCSQHNVCRMPDTKWQSWVLRAMFVSCFPV